RQRPLCRCVGAVLVSRSSSIGNVPSGTPCGLDGMAIEAWAYWGPRPSPARRWAPWLIVAAAVTVTCDVIRVVLNLVERHYQQQIAAGHSPNRATVRHVLS